MNPLWIDSHHHLWNLEQISYPWLMAKGEERFFGQPDPIRKNYLVNDFCDDHQNEIVKSVHVQVGAIQNDALNETKWLTDCAKQAADKFPAKAVVAVDMLADDVEAQILAHKQYGVTQGVRHIIGKSEEENKTLPKFEAEKWLHSFSLLIKHNLSFDLQFTHEQYKDVFHVLEKVPELKVVICHLASPWDQSPAGFKHWQENMQRFAQLPNCYMKLSGFSMFNHKMIADKFFEYCHEAIKLFSPQRCMFGSNFPVDKLYISYQALFELWQEVVSQYSSDDAHFLRYETANQFYQID
ncbi:MAG: amidohydrolase family protein [Colwellia sp.]